MKNGVFGITVVFDWNDPKFNDIFKIEKISAFNKLGEKRIKTNE